jgi:hypothetical protein
MMAVVSPKKYYSFMIEAEMAAALKRVKERDGVSESEQIRRGIQLWLDTKGEPRKAATRPARTGRKA